MEGWVYVLTNEAMPNLVKVGYSMKDPNIRAQKLSDNTGVPLPYVVQYKALVKNPKLIEGQTHKALDKFRLNSNREFFQCDAGFVKQVVEDLTEVIFFVSTDEINKRNQIRKEYSKSFPEIPAEDLNEFVEVELKTRIELESESSSKDLKELFVGLGENNLHSLVEKKFEKFLSVTDKDKIEVSFIDYVNSQILFNHKYGDKKFNCDHLSYEEKKSYSENHLSGVTKGVLINIAVHNLGYYACKRCGKIPAYPLERKKVYRNIQEIIGSYEYLNEQLSQSIFSLLFYPNFENKFYHIKKCKENIEENKRIGAYSNTLKNFNNFFYEAEKKIKKMQVKRILLLIFLFFALASIFIV